MINKVLKASFQIINHIASPQTLRMETDHYLLNNYDIKISKAETGFSAHINFKMFKGFSSSQIHSIEFEEPIKLNNDANTYFVSDKSLFFHQKYPPLDSADNTVELKGTIRQIASSIDPNSFNGKFLRHIIYLDSSRTKLTEIRGWNYKSDLSAKNKSLVKVQIEDSEYHFMEFQLNNQTFLVIDTTEVCPLEKFKNVVYNILITFGFIYGDLFMNEGYILSSPDEEFRIIEDISFSTYSETLLTGYRIHTTNSYSIHNLTGKTTEEIESKEGEAKKWINDLVEIEESVFSRLCELFYKHEPLSRSAMIVIQGNMFSLKIKGSAYSVALEAITAFIIKENKEKIPKPVEKVVFNEIKMKFNEILDEILPRNEENNATREIFKNRIDNLNKPTNAEKLRQAFECVEYKLGPHEFAALKARDKFQHGELPVSENNHDTVFKEVYFVCLMMHRLIYILLLKRAGYSGYIINYPQLYSGITEKDLGEQLFYKL